tara:strand:- start:887 stop:1162 length:276 start_codon:yes stop_codon:yes gene_type:complete
MAVAEVVVIILLEPMADLVVETEEVDLLVVKVVVTKVVLVHLKVFQEVQELLLTEAVAVVDLLQLDQIMIMMVEVIIKKELLVDVELLFLL